MPLLQQFDEFANVSPALQWAIFIVACFVAVVAAIAVIISIWLWIKYVVYNRRKNAKGLSGKEVARRILDKHGLQRIKVSTFGSFLFGNSYSHYFKKVRLRRLTANKTSITSLAMGAEKSALALLDKEGDKDMKTRVRLTPFMYFGPIMFVPIVAIGVLIDIALYQFKGVATVVSAVLGLGLYVISFFLSLMTLKTEKKAQARACKIMKEEGLATQEEIAMAKDLYKLYNIQYVNDLILEFLQLVLKILQVVAKVQNSSASRND